MSILLKTLQNAKKSAPGNHNTDVVIHDATESLERDELAGVPQQALQEIETTDAYIEKVSMELTLEDTDHKVASSSVYHDEHEKIDAVDDTKIVVEPLDVAGAQPSETGDTLSHGGREEVLTLDIAVPDSNIAGESEQLDREEKSIEQAAAASPSLESAADLMPSSSELANVTEGDEQLEEQQQDVPVSMATPSIANEFYQARRKRQIRFYSLIASIVIISAVAAVYTSWLWLHDGVIDENMADDMAAAAAATDDAFAVGGNLVAESGAIEHPSNALASIGETASTNIDVQASKMDIGVRTSSDADKTFAEYSQPLKQQEPTEGLATNEIVISKRVFGESEKRLIGQASAAFAVQDYFNAGAYYQQALSRNPASVDALNGLAAVNVAKGNVKAAQEGFYRVLMLDPSNKFARVSLIGLMQGVSAKEKEIELVALSKQFPEDALIHTALGEHYASQNLWMKAQSSFFSAFELNPENPQYQYNLAVSLDNLGKSQLAAQYYESLLSHPNMSDTAISHAAVERRLTRLRTK